jgi:hypothetical protein
MTNIELQRTEQPIAFLDVDIGRPFYAHNSFWIRTSYEAAKDLTGAYRVCNFTLDDCDRVVERVQINYIS